MENLNVDRVACPPASHSGIGVPASRCAVPPSRLRGLCRDDARAAAASRHAAPRRIRRSHAARHRHRPDGYRGRHPSRPRPAGLHELAAAEACETLGPADAEGRAGPRRSRRRDARRSSRRYRRRCRDGRSGPGATCGPKARIGVCSRVWSVPRQVGSLPWSAVMTARSPRASAAWISGTRRSKASRAAA